MTAQSEALARAENRLRDVSQNYQGRKRVSKEELQKALDGCDWKLWVAYADMAYFLARTLLAQGVSTYAGAPVKRRDCDGAAPPSFSANALRARAGCRNVTLC